jgi:hypothetical protein
MQHTAAAPHGSRERLPAPDLYGLPGVPRRLPARLRRRASVTVPPA